MKRKTILLLVVLGLLCGGLTFPWTNLEMVFLEAREGVNWIPQTALLSREELHLQRNLARWYNFSIREEQPDKGLLGAYLDVLDFGEGQMGYLHIPSGGQVYPIFHETGTEPGQDMVIHQFGTALPIGGRGNCAVLYCGEELDLAPGDVFEVPILDEVLTYRVREVGDSLPREFEQEDLCVLRFSGKEGMVYITGLRQENSVNLGLTAGVCGSILTASIQ